MSPESLLLSESFLNKGNSPQDVTQLHFSVNLPQSSRSTIGVFMIELLFNSRATAVQTEEPERSARLMLGSDTDCSICLLPHHTHGFCAFGLFGAVCDSSSRRSSDIPLGCAHFCSLFFFFLQVWYRYAS